MAWSPGTILDEGGLTQLAWSPDGQKLAILGDNRCRGIDGHAFVSVQSKGLTTELARWSNVRTTSLAWSPDSERVALTGYQVAIRDLASSSQHEIALPEDTIYVDDAYLDVAWSPDGKLVVWLDSWSDVVGLWQRGPAKSVPISSSQGVQPSTLCWMPEPMTLAIGAARGDILLWDPREGTFSHVLAGSATVSCLHWSQPLATLCVGSTDGTVRLWDPAGERSEVTLEGHRRRVAAIGASSEGLLIGSLDADGVLRLWSTKTNEPIAEFDGVAAFAFHPEHSQLAVAGRGDGRVDLLKYDRRSLVARREAVERMVHYANARIVLAGDTTVGKSGLSLRLLRQPFAATESTHALKVHLLETATSTEPANGVEVREAYLWDLAGQPGYRLFHREHLANAAVALVLFDSRDETHPLGGVRYWSRAIDHATAGRRVVKFLVPSRVDRGGPRLSDGQLSALVQELAFAAIVPTSAKRGDGVEALRARILAAIEWDALPHVSSPAIFRALKDFLLEERVSNHVVRRRGDLLDLFRAKTHAEGTTADLDICLVQQESAGIVRRLQFGDLILLRPELLDEYMGYIAIEARSDPSECGCVAEHRIRQAEIPMDTGRLLAGTEEERLLLTATLEDLLGAGIALRQATPSGDMIVFPAQTRAEPDQSDLEMRRSVAFDFDGAITSIYSRLGVFLSYSGSFSVRRFHRDGAVFTSASGERCAYFLGYRDPLNDSSATLQVAFAADVSSETRARFVEFIRQHLERHAFRESVRSRALQFCTCDYEQPIAQEILDWRREHGFPTAACAACGTHYKLEGEIAVDERAARAARHDSDEADYERERQKRLASLEKRMDLGPYDVLISYATVDEREMQSFADRLARHGLACWIARDRLLPGDPLIPSLLETLRSIPVLACFLTRAWTQSGWANYEALVAVQRMIEEKRLTQPDGGSVMPVLLPSYPPSELIPEFLRPFVHVDFRSLLGLSADEEERSMERLVRRLVKGVLKHRRT
jgi:WD40 repeat protein